MAWRLVLAVLRGEGVLQDRFFLQLMAKLPVRLDAEQQVALWQEFVEHCGHITGWLQRLGIARALRRETVVPADISKESRKLYTLLLDALSEQAPELLPGAVEDNFWHVWRGRFPEAPALPVKAGTTQADVLRERLVRALRRRYAENVELKASIHQEEDRVRFALHLKLASVGRWEELLPVERPRLKTARLAAYDEAMNSTRAGEAA